MMRFGAWIAAAAACVMAVPASAAAGSVRAVLDFESGTSDGRSYFEDGIQITPFVNGASAPLALQDGAIFVPVSGSLSFLPQFGRGGIAFLSFDIDTDAPVYSDGSEQRFTVVPDGRPGFQRVTVDVYTLVKSPGLQLTATPGFGFVLDNVVLTNASIPEPSSWALLIVGVGGVGGALRRRRVLTFA